MTSNPNIDYGGGALPVPPSDEERIYALEQKMRASGDEWVAIHRDDILLLLGRIGAMSDDERVGRCVVGCMRLDHPEHIPSLIAATAAYIAMHEAKKKTNLPEGILELGREKIHDALDLIHG